MDSSIKQAQKQGERYAVKATLVTELGLALLSFTLLLLATHSAQVFWDIITYLGAVNVAVFVVASVLFAYLVGRNAGVKILVKKRRYAWVGLFSGLKVVFFSTLVCVATALLVQSVMGPLELGWLVDFIMKPFAWVALLCLVPVALAGIWYGYTLRRSTERP
ncbi:hypothetical protein [Rufibacter soli]